LVDLVLNVFAKDISKGVNVGAGEAIRIADLAFLISEVVGFEGEIVFDKSKARWDAQKTVRCTPC